MGLLRSSNRGHDTGPNWLIVALLKNRLDHAVLACSLWIGQSNNHPLNYPINLLEDDLCKTKVLK